MAARIPIIKLLGVGAVGAVAGFSVGCSYFCGDPPWSQPPGFWDDREDTLEIPVDAAPWLLRPCDRQVAPSDCALVVDGERIPVVASVVGADACPDPDDDDYEYMQATPTVIQTLQPAHWLPPGAFAILDCEGDDNEYTPEYYGFISYYYDDPDRQPALHVRGAPNPAAAPIPLADLALHYTRGEPENCGPSGNYLALRLDFDAAYLREGGYVEVLYPDGQAIAVRQANENDVAWIPASYGPLSLTPVAIDGQRGETVVVDEDDMTEDLVYIPGCAVDPAGNKPGLLALAWLLVARRRRRSA